MALDLLDTPVRLTWDFPDAATGLTGPSLPAIADSVVDGGVFFVTLQGRPLLHPEFTRVLKILAGRCQLLVVSGGKPAELACLADLPRSGCQLLLDASSFVTASDGVDASALLEVIQSIRRQSIEPLLSLTPLRHNLCNIPELMRFCSDHEITKLKLPNAHIGDSFQDYATEDLPRWQDLESFRKIWLDFMKNPCQLPTLEIHDLFLWEIMTPGEQQNRAEYGGCQAANSLGHIDVLGVVHPCAAWPEPLGSLPGQLLEEIWEGSARLTVRDHIAQVAQGCHGCRDLGLCFGGCRGLAFHLNRSEGERDLMCSGPR